MNIAFVARSEQNSLNSLYLQHVVEASTELIDAGHEVMIVMNRGVLLKRTDFPRGVELIEIEFQNSPWRTRYLSESQAISDQFLLAVSEVNSISPLDVIEFPLWGGLGFSTLRCKRLLGYCKSTRIVTNAIFAHALLEEGNESFFPTPESEIASEMESYVLRHSDLICSPFEVIGQKLQTRLGRSDINYYESKVMLDSLSDDDLDEPASVLKALVGRRTETAVDAIRVREIFEQPGRRQFSKKESRATLSAVIPFHSQSSADSIAEKLSGLTPDELDIVYFCDSEEFEVQETYESYSPANGRKYEPKSVEFSAFDVFEACKSDYLMIIDEYFDVNDVYIRTAISSLSNNPELAYVGAYLGGNIQYPVGYVPTLMPLINTCPVAGNIFRRRSLLACLKDVELCFGETMEWDILNAIHRRYQSGDIIPHTFCTVSGEFGASEYAAATRLRKSLEQKQFLATHSHRILKLLVSFPDLLTAKGPETITSEEWEFSVPVCRKLTEEMAIAAPVESEEEVSESEDDLDEVRMEDSPEEESEFITGKLSFESAFDDKVNPSEEVDEQPDINEMEKLSFEEDAFSEEESFEQPEEAEEDVSPGVVVNHASPLRLAREEEQVELPEEHWEEEAAVNDPDWFQVFWSRDKAFIEEDSITEPYQEGERLYLEFAINAAKEVNTIRLDPCNRPGVISIRKIEVRDNESDLIVFSASEDNAFDNIEPAGDFDVTGIEQDALILKSTGIDPQLMIDIPHTTIRNFTLTMRYDYRRTD